MSRRVVGILVQLGLSVVLGVLAGEFFFKIWMKTVPSAVTTTFNTGSAHAYYLWAGAEMGLAFFLWGLLAPLVARIFRPKPVAPGAARA
jgi:hypothetical protein